MKYPMSFHEKAIELYDNGQSHCEACGVIEFLDVHHIYPRSLGGDDTEENLIVLCRSCHMKADWALIKQEKE